MSSSAEATKREAPVIGGQFFMVHQFDQAGDVEGFEVGFCRRFDLQRLFQGLALVVLTRWRKRSDRSR